MMILLQGPPITENKSQRIKRIERIDRGQRVNFQVYICVLSVRGLYFCNLGPSLKEVF
jgi:hypothetical protein